MAKMDPKIFIFKYFNELDDLVDLVKSEDHFQLLNTNLEFFIKLSTKNPIKNDHLNQQMENLLINLLNKKDDNRFNHNEINFIIIFCELFNLYDDANLNEKIGTLILNSDLVDLELKIEIIQNLLKKRLVNFNSNFYIDFIFKSLDTLFDEITKSASNQQRTKLINSIIWILFDFLRNDLFFEYLVENISRFLDRIVENAKSEDDQLIESVLDFIASLIRFVEKDAKSEIKLENLQKINSIVDNDKTKEFITKSMLNKSNSSIRKKARYITNQLKFLPLDAIEILEGLEERQLHLVRPILDKKLSLLVVKNLKLKIDPYETVMEIVVERMLNHECKMVKLYALYFINEQLTYSNDPNSKIEFFLKEQFILNQIISALNDSQIYNEDFYDGQPLDLLNLVPKEKILKSILNKTDNLTLYGLFFLIKKLDSNHLHKNTCSFVDELDKQTVQNLFTLIDEYCSEGVLKSTAMVSLIRILAYGLKNDAKDFKFFLNLLNFFTAKNVKLENVLSNDIVSLFNDYSDDLSLVYEFNLIGYARYWSIMFNKNLNLGKFYQVLKKLSTDDSSQFKAFLSNFLKSINFCDEKLWDFLSEKNLIDLDVLRLVCYKEINLLLAQKVSEFLRNLINQSDEQIKFSFLALLDSLHSRYIKSEDYLLSTELDKIFNQTDLKLDTLNKMHWKLINNYLRQKTNFNLQQVLDLFHHKQTGSKLDFILNLISTSPTNLNFYVVEFLSLVLNNELTYETADNEIVILKNFFELANLMFNSCLEINKVNYYVKLFKIFIEGFAFRGSLFHTKRGRKFLEDSDNFENLNDLFDRINSLNTLQVKSLLISHFCNLVEDDPLLLKNQYFGSLLFNCLELGCLFDRENRSLTDYLKIKLKNDRFIDKYLDLELDLDFYKRTRLNALLTCFKLDLDSLRILTNKMILNEDKIFKTAKIRNFPNSNYHRMQTKILQFLLIATLRLLKVLDSLSDQDNNRQKIISLLRLIFDASIKGIVNQSSNQYSVKLLQQLIVISIIRYENSPKEFYDDFRDLLSFESKSRFLVDLQKNEHNEINKVGFITALLSIVYHVVDSKPDLKYYPFNYLVICNHYKTRLFSHLVLLKCGSKLNFPTTDSEDNLQLETAPKSISGSHNIVRNLKVFKYFSYFIGLY